MTTQHPDHKKAGAVLRAARERAELSQTDIFKLWGETRTGRLSNIEAGIAGASLSFLQRFGDEVGVTVRLIASEPGYTPADDLCVRILEAKLSPSRQRLLHAVLDCWESEDDEAAEVETVDVGAGEGGAGEGSDDAR